MQEAACLSFFAVPSTPRRADAGEELLPSRETHCSSFDFYTLMPETLEGVMWATDPMVHQRIITYHGSIWLQD